METKKVELETKEKAIRDYLSNYPILKSLLAQSDIREKLVSSAPGLVD